MVSGTFDVSSDSHEKRHEASVTTTGTSCLLYWISGLRLLDRVRLPSQTGNATNR